MHEHLLWLWPSNDTHLDTSQSPRQFRAWAGSCTHMGAFVQLLNVQLATASNKAVPMHGGCMAENNLVRKLAQHVKLACAAAGR